MFSYFDNSNCQCQYPQSKYLTEHSERAVQQYLLSTAPTRTQLDMPILHTSKNVMEADALLNKAGLKVEEFRGTLGQDNYEMAQGWLEM